MKKNTYDQTGKAANRKWQRNPLFWFAIAFILYLIIGFLGVPPIAKGVIKDFIETDLKRPVTIGSIGFNPLTFSLSIDDFYLYEPDSNVFISCREIYVNPDVLPVISGVIEIDAMAVCDAEVRFVRNPDSTFNLNDIVGNLLTLVADSTGNADSWELRLNHLAVYNAAAVFEDHVLSPHFSYAIDSVQFQLNNLHLFSPDTATWQANLKLSRGGIAEAGGMLLTDKVSSDFSFRVYDLAFQPFQPLLKQWTHLRIDSGTAEAFGDVHVQLDSLLNPLVIDYIGNVSIYNLSLYDLLKNETFLGWDTVTTSGISAGLIPFSATITEITAQNFFTRMAVAEDQSFNVVDVLQPLIQLVRSDSTIIDMFSPENFTLTIGRVEIVDGGSYFSDLSLPLPFAVHVHALNGDILNIAPDNPMGAQLNVVGTVDQYGYAAARGNFDPFDPLALTDIDVVFDNIELTSLSPYSAKFAGYALKSGKISMDLSYKIRDGQLQGSNQMLLNKITLGEKIKSEKATELPVKLAIALMKDSEGNIDLDVDVKGDLNDPQISMGSLIWQAIKKVIVNIVSAPFNFLGKLLGINNGQEMEYIQFSPGSSKLPPHQQEKLINLDKVMKARTGIKLEIYGTYDKVFDKKALQGKKFEIDYLSRRKVNDKNDSTDHTLNRETLEILFRERFSENTLVQLQTRYNVSKQDSQAIGDNIKMNKEDLRGYYKAMQEQLIDAQPVTETELEELALERGQLIRTLLIETNGIKTARVTIKKTEVLEKEDDEWVKCRLAIDAM